jgi:N-acetylmuramic acid 6-phosphate etherase
LLCAEELATAFEQANREAAAAVEGARAEIAAAICAAYDALAAGGRVILTGAGTSGRLAVLEATECWPTFSSRAVVGLMAGGERAFVQAKEGAEDDEAAGVREANALGLAAHDLVIGVTASGRTPWVWGTLEAGRAAGAPTIIICCSPPARDGADVVIHLRTGPEVLAGSTRLKAGTATKCVLNAITTGAMARLGKVMDDLMVDVVPSNAKLVRRATRIVAELAGVDAAQARALVKEAGEVKTAVVMGKLSLDVVAARARLEAAGGHLRRALDAGEA